MGRACLSTVDMKPCLLLPEIFGSQDFASVLKAADDPSLQTVL